MKAILFGHGGIAETHLAALRALGHSVTWVVGRDRDRAEAFAKRHGIPHAADSLTEALESDADAVHICTPPARHGEAILACLAAGKHVISEKPLTLSAKEAETLCIAAENSGRVAALCCNVRFYPANRAAAEAVKAGAIGRPLVLHGAYLQEFHAPPHADGWRFDPGQNGGMRAIGEIGTHWIDLAYAWTGARIEAVSAALGNWYPVRYRRDGMLYAAGEGTPVPVETEDAAAVALRFSGGAIGTLMLSEVSRGHFNDLSLETAGNCGTLRWEEANPGTLWRSENGALRPEAYPVGDRTETFVSLFREAYADMRGLPHAPYPTFWDGLYIARVSEAIHRSGETGKWEKV